MDPRNKDRLKNEFAEILPLFKESQLKSFYQSLYDEYLRCYSSIYLKELIKKLLISKEINDLEKQDLIEEIASYADQLLKSIQKKETFQQFIFISMVSDSEKIPKNIEEIKKSLKQIKKKIPKEAEKFIETITDSILKNYLIQKKRTDSVDKKENEEIHLNETIQSQNKLIQSLRFDYNNLKSRMKKQEEQYKEILTGEILKKMIPFIDHFKIALDNYHPENPDKFFEGMKLIYRQMMEILKKDYGFSLMAEIGKQFDYQRHEAVSNDGENNIDKNFVIEELSNGYEVNGKILRYPKVRVGNIDKVKKKRNI